MADFTDVLKLNDLEYGAIHQIVCDNQLVWRRPNHNLNRVPLSIDTDGSIYNGCGYIEGYRLNSSGGLSAVSATYVVAATGFIPYTPGDIVRMYGTKWTPYYNDQKPTGIYNYIVFYDENFSCLGSVSIGNGGDGYSRGICGSDTTAHNIIEDHQNCITEFHIAFTDPSAIKYIRISSYGHGDYMTITINEPIINKKLFTN